MHIPVRGEELSELSAMSGAIFLASKLLEIYQEIGEIASGELRVVGSKGGGSCN